MSNDGGGFVVRDKRFWQQAGEAGPPGEGGPGADEAPGYTESKPSYVEELEQKVVTKERELRELVATYKKDVTQTVEETKLRLRRDAERQLELERAKLVEAMLPVLDNLTLAISAARRHAAEPGAAALIDGVAMVEKLFVERLGGLGVERFESVGQPFDPKVHEAVTMVPSRPDQEGKVVAELRPGFRMGDRVIRPAMVQVGRAG